VVAMVEANAVRDMLFDGKEIAFFDVREGGQFGDGHPFFAVSVPYSNFEVRLFELAPTFVVRMVLYDNDDGIAALAAARAAALGYTNVSIMAGGAAAWSGAGYTLYKGEHLPSKTFGELLEINNDTPNLTSEQVMALKAENPNHIIVDSRPYGEYNDFNIPGGICCPNGESTLRIGELVPDPETTIIVNCAGRTRSILGAETLRAFGIPNPVYALKNGTQGWFLAGLKREEGATRTYPNAPTLETKLAPLRERAEVRAAKTGLKFIEPIEAAIWLADTTRSTYLIDVRSDEEFKADGISGSRHALGGQLVQGIDIWVGVRGSRVIVMDNEMIRAPMMANWIHQIGYDVAVLRGGVDAMRGIAIPDAPAFVIELITAISPAAVKSQLGSAQLVDLRSPRVYRAGHVEGATWSIRPRFQQLGLSAEKSVVLITPDDGVAALAAQRLSGLGITSVQQLSGNEATWRDAGLQIVATPDEPSDADSIELVYHWQHRNNPNGGNAAAARAYIDWEIGLVDQLDEQERGSFRLAAL
jgi:rhodanese-related sulfurtransferase